MVAHMNCVDLPVTYFDYENVTTEAMADSLDCTVSMVPVCTPLKSTKCGEVKYTKCQEIPETVCTTVDIPVPSQPILHKQWCLFDQEDNIDFDKQVRRITNEANKEKTTEQDDDTVFEEEIFTDEEPFTLDLVDDVDPVKRQVQRKANGFRTALYTTL